MENTNEAKDIEKPSSTNDYETATSPLKGESKSDRLVRIFPDASDTSVTKTILRSDWEKMKENPKNHKNVYPSEVAGQKLLGKVVPSALQQKDSVSKPLLEAIQEHKLTDNEELRKLAEEQDKQEDEALKT